MSITLLALPILNGYFMIVSLTKFQALPARSLLLPPP